MDAGYTVLLQGVLFGCFILYGCRGYCLVVVYCSVWLQDTLVIHPPTSAGLPHLS